MIKKEYFISINPFAQFSKESFAGKKKIIKNQKKPNKYLIPWYQRAKGAIKKYLINIDNHEPIDSAIEILLSKIPNSERQKIDIRSSIQALQLMKRMKLPAILNEIDYDIVSVDEKDVILNGVKIKIAPELIIKGIYEGKTIFGAIKIHICKGTPFDFEQCELVSSLIYKYLNNIIHNEEIRPELCLCLDVFSGRIVSLPSNYEKMNIEINKVCEEVKQIWNIA